MQPIAVTLHAGPNAPGVPPFKTHGYVPDPASHLAVARVSLWDYTTKAWKEDATEWRVVHRPTGYFVGKLTWSGPGEAMRVLQRCQPHLAAWEHVRFGSPKTDPAMRACVALYSVATGVPVP